MLSTVILIVAFTPAILGAVVTEKSLDDHRERKGYADAAEEPVEEYRGGNLTITGSSGGRFFNPQWDTAEGRQSQRLLQKYSFVTMNPDDDVAFIQIKINSLLMQNSIDGDCINDKMEIFDNDFKPVKTDPSVLCGTINDQTFTIPNTNGPYEILLKVLPRCPGTDTRFGRQYTKRPTWNVTIEYLPNNDGNRNTGNNEDNENNGNNGNDEGPTRRLATPFHCVQYHTATSGTIKSFNYGGDMLNNMDYSICFGYEAGRHCGVEFTFRKLDLGNFKDRPLDALMRIAYGTRDTRGCMTTTNRRRPPPNNNGTCEHEYLLIGGERHCGDHTDYHVTAYGRSPTVVNVVSGMSNRFGEKGFYANYRMLRC